ncbi:MAG: methyltransferase domain-containing protein, partial [Acidobacteriota bacterium]
MPTPLFELDGVNRFSDRADAYALGRPSYPLPAIDWTLQNRSAPRVLDAGAGTGIGSRLLRDRGARTIALDPNLAMLAAGGRSLPLACGAAEELPFDAST